MRYRALSATGDYVFGQGSAQILVDSREAVAQAVQTRLALSQGEWLLDLTEGTPNDTKILGENTQSVYDPAIQERILGTPGVVGITDYSSVLDQDRHLSVAAAIMTIYGSTTFQQVF